MSTSPAGFGSVRRNVTASRLILTTLVACVSLTGHLRADVLHLTTGKDMRGRVIAYANMNFEVENEDRLTVKVSPAAVKSIEFTAADAKLDTRTQGSLDGTITRYENGAFTLQTKDGKTTQVSLVMIKTASFAGEGADKVVLQVQDGNLEKYLVAGKVTIVDFYADWCGPCRYIGPILEKIAKSDEAVVLRKVNVDQNQVLSRKYGVRGIPQIMIFDKQGKLAGTVIGANRDKVEQYIKQAKD